MKNNYWNKRVLISLFVIIVTIFFLLCSGCTDIVPEENEYNELKKIRKESYSATLLDDIDALIDRVEDVDVTDEHNSIVHDNADQHDDPEEGEE